MFVLQDRLIYFATGKIYRIDENIDESILVAPDQSFSDPDEFTIFGDAIVFTARSNDPTANPNRHLHITDGTTSGTDALLDLGPRSPNHALRISEHSYTTSPGGVLYFAGSRPKMEGGFRRELWRTDGTSAGTTEILYPFDDTPSINDLAYFADGLLIYLSESGQEKSLWHLSLDNPAEPKLLQRFENIHHFLPEAALDRGFCFLAADGDHGLELWITDGSTSGSQIVKDILPGPDSSEIDHLTRHGSDLYFGSTDGIHGYELWRSDGTADNTRMVLDLQPGAESGVPHRRRYPHPIEFESFGTSLVFIANDGPHGFEPWITDGSAGGTRLLADINDKHAAPSSSQIFFFCGRVIKATVFHKPIRVL